MVPRSNAGPTGAEHEETPHEDATERRTQRDGEPANATRELVDTLRSENAFLRDELAARTEEIRRRDHIIAGFIERLPELPTDTGRNAPQDVMPVPPHDHAPAPAPKHRPWWRRLLRR